jgi:hypothetical protein
LLVILAEISVPNPLHVFAEHNLLPPIVELRRPAVRVIGNILRSLKRPAFLKKASQAGSAEKNEASNRQKSRLDLLKQS